MTVQIDWRAFFTEMLPGFELVAMEANEGIDGTDEVLMEILCVNPAAKIPEDRECRVLAECVRQMCCYASLVERFNADIKQPGLNVAMTFLEP